jgi:hypothetical protein
VGLALERGKKPSVTKIGVIAFIMSLDRMLTRTTSRI